MSNTLPNSLKAMLLKGHIAGAADTFKIILMQPGFVFDEETHHAYGDVSASEVADGLGYTSGGQTLANVAIAIDAVNDIVTMSWDDVHWTAAAGSLITSGAIIYDDSTAVASGDDYEDAVVSYIDAGGIKVASDGTLVSIADINIKIN